MSETKLILGPPGTGKTTRLLDEVERCFKAGIAPEEIAFMGFSKKSAHEAKERACERFGLNKERFPLFDNLHALAFRMLKLSPNDVLQNSDFKEIGKALKWADFKNDYNEMMERPPQYGGKGDICVSLYGLHRATFKDIKTILREADYRNISEFELDMFIKTLEKYKREFNKLDFADFLDMARTPLKAKVFIIDEAQDLTRQQWNFARALAAQAEYKLIAGDDDQAIYQWSGADPSYFQRIAAPREVLPVSYRLPRAVFRKADYIAKKIKKRFPKEWSPRDAEGMVKAILSPEEVKLADAGTWLLLARNQYQLKDLQQIAESQGLVYRMKDTWSNQADHIQAAVTYHALLDGKSVSAARVRIMNRFIHGSKNPETGKAVTWNELRWPFEGRPDWMQALNKLTAEQKAYIRGLKRRGESLVNPGRVIISTIHGSKGGEADNVLLLTGMSGQNSRGFDRDPDQETRVWYVAASRAKENLYYVQGGKERTFNF